MRFVNPAHSLAEQNLVACQNSGDIYFYTIRPVEPNQELLVWYSQEFAQRLCGQQGEIKPSEYRPKTDPDLLFALLIFTGWNSSICDPAESNLILVQLDLSTVQWSSSNQTFAILAPYFAHFA